ncbi:hypothetical protein PAPYR_4674 [Paratrimastix pyriformis]|uniref:Uncharacterized protein n=1 Tax=Paratrimastix pyriformis TaxID=342808 RepID=A0ABQ8UJG4_9EUKA|nr:hypothetical protein PAPYR_4674 [Paratrimastix pyriformis]
MRLGVVLKRFILLAMIGSCFYFIYFAFSGPSSSWISSQRFTVSTPRSATPLLTLYSISHPTTLDAWRTLHRTLLAPYSPFEEPSLAKLDRAATTPFVMWVQDAILFEADLLPTLESLLDSMKQVAPSNSIPSVLLIGHLAEVPTRMADFFIWSKGLFAGSSSLMNYTAPNVAEATLRRHCGRVLQHRGERPFLTIDISGTVSAHKTGTPPFAPPHLPPQPPSALSPCFSTPSSLLYTAPGPAGPKDIALRVHPHVPRDAAILAKAGHLGGPLVTLMSSPRAPPTHCELLAMKSWHWMASRGLIDVLILGSHPDVVAAVAQFPEFSLETKFPTRWDLPVLKGCWQLVEQRGRTPFVMYTNGDIQFYPDLYTTAAAVLEEAQRLNKTRIMIAGRRINMEEDGLDRTTFHQWSGRPGYLQPVRDPLNTTDQREGTPSVLRDAWTLRQQPFPEDHYAAELTEGTGITQSIKVTGTFFQNNAMDYFCWTPGTIRWEEVYDYVLGRVCFDNWIMGYGNHAALKENMFTVDATNTVTAVHINHGRNRFESHEKPHNEWNKDLFREHLPIEPGLTDRALFFTYWQEVAGKRQIVFGTRQFKKK